jgi:hypothetical protein
MLNIQQKMKPNDPQMQNFHRNPRRPNKPFGTNNPKYSFYHHIERKPAKIGVFVVKCILLTKKWTYLSI